MWYLLFWLNRIQTGQDGTHAMAEEHAGALDDLATGALLAGRYRLRERVGRGGMADVFAAEDTVLHRPVAVKVFRVDAGTGEDPRRIEAEARTLAALRHPGLVMVLDAGAAPERAGERAAPFIVMELITGPTLSQRLTQGPLGTRHTAVLGADLATALAYVHAQGIVHRDVKPANVLLDAPTADGSPFAARLTDFGIARLVDSTRLTMHGTTVGTANYLSPEQVSSSDVTPASDVYSLALVLIECLTGQLAYPGVGIEAALARLHRPPIIPAEHGPDWTALLTAMTATDPAARPSAAQVAATLRPLVQTPDTASIIASPLAATEALTRARGPSNSTMPLATPPELDAAAGPDRQWWAGRRWPYYAAALVAAAVIIMLIAVLSGSHHPSPSAPGPAPAYPSAPGQLGSDLHKLEGTIG